MSQERILSVLYRNRTEWLSTKDIANKLNVASRNITVGLRKLRRYNEVYWRSLPRGIVYKFRE